MDYLSGWCESTRRLDGYTAIVTGSNCGIGKETLLDFYKRGARVIMACRDPSKAEAAKTDIETSLKTKEGKGALIIEELDLASLNSVRNFAQRILATETQIQILVNNAGVMACPQGETEDGFETHMGTNHFGHALLTLLLLPRLIKSSPSRIVFVSSYLHRADFDINDLNYKKSPYNSFKAYGRSKAANVLFSKALAVKIKEHDVETVNTYSLHPGVVGTELGRHLSTSIWLGATWVYHNILNCFMKSPRCGAQTTIYCAVDEVCADESGLYYSDCQATTTSQTCQDEALALQLWDLTIAGLNLEQYNPFGGADPSFDSIF